MIYRAIQLIKIFLADGRTDEGVPRGPRGPKKNENCTDPAFQPLKCLQKSCTEISVLTACKSWKLRELCGKRALLLRKRLSVTHVCPHFVKFVRIVIKCECFVLFKDLKCKISSIFYLRGAKRGGVVIWEKSQIILLFLGGSPYPE